ncbi:histidine kinase [Actinokineospora auranticolor]|uniref:histidine kinase n=1 Tax=Actinokineospora auranticolor TaxID=155976 RepID=A0A2S6GEG0_9PSEU|nr:histidine kinase [Actinokineospora auranticolor]PPK63615.1 signal transduction histidine kinase [Actinokineospora auranticolor]
MRAREWIRSVDRRAGSAVDGSVAVLAFAAMVVVDPWSWRAIGLSAVVAAGVALRRRTPVAGYLLGSLGLIAQSLLATANPVAPYANLLGLYSVGLHAAPRRALWGPVILLPGILAYFVADPVPAPAAAGTVFTWLLGWALGYVGARSRDRQEVERELARRAAVAEERARMARELHDLVGHTVNVMLVQAGASRLVLDSDPDQARELLSGVERTGREALDELDRVLGGLRQDVPEAGLDRLVARMTEAGMRVDLRVTAPPLPGAVEQAVYRIVQEALTNALTHGEARSATVAIAADECGVVVEIHDHGSGPESGYRPGRGLTGIGERVSVLGGTVVHGGGEGGGFRLRVVLPLG